jgi:WD40 repeat protein
MCSYRYRIQAVAGCVLFFAIQLAIELRGQALPPESTLPGRVAPLPESAKLPPESALPAGSPPAVENVVPPVVTPPADDSSQPPAPPSEATLPASMRQKSATGPNEIPPESVPVPAESADPDGGNGQPGAAQPASPLQLERSLDNTPWLRLQMPGHVSTIRTLAFSSDGRRLCAAGDDKCVVVWRRTDQGHWFHERTVRWQVQRGPRGRIDALAAAPGLLAFGGLGAMGEAGEILLIDPAAGNLVAPLSNPDSGHRERITSLAFSLGEQAPLTLASMDMSGHLIAWRADPGTGLWRPRTVAFDRATAESLQRWRMLHPVAMLGTEQIVAPYFAGADADGRVRWQLRRYDLSTGDATGLDLNNDFHYFFVTAMAAAPVRGTLASADDAGRLFFWQQPGRAAPVTRTMKSPVTSLQFDAQGERLLVGTHATPSRPGEVSLLDATPAGQLRPVWSQPVNESVLASAVDPAGAYFAYAQGGKVLVRSLADPAQLQQLSAPLHPPLRVAFRRSEPYYDIAIGTRLDEQGNVPLERFFDTTNLQLSTPQQMDAGQWNRPDSFRGEWNVSTEQTANEFTVYLMRGNRRQATIPLRLEIHGAPSAICWIPNAAQRAAGAVAIGTNGSNNIYVFDLAEQGECRLLRQFRGHEGAVTSIGVATDRRYLVSGGLDGTVRIWKLADLDNDPVPVQRWGAQFQEQDGELVAAQIRPDGPLYFRGLRTGDIVASLRLPDAVNGQVNVTTVHEPDEMQVTLGQRPWDRLTAFDYRRGRQANQSFQMYPAWQPVVSLYVAENREWAYWTPSGYYDASFEGDKLFGWQVNRGLQQLPDFFLAAQVRQSLERPDVLRRLLDVGDLESAFGVADREAPANWSRVLIKQQQLKPDVQILAPSPDETMQGSVLEIRAAIDVPAGETLVALKAFVNGVTAGAAELLGEQDSARGRLREYRWSASVPSDPQLLVQVLASTDTAVVGRAERLVSHRVERSDTRRQLYLVTAGINDYLDARLTRLEYAVDNAQQVAATFTSQSRPLYATRTVSLLNQHVTRPMWNLTVEQLASQMSQSVSPDDLLVIYLSGHGLRDADQGDYYYVSADAKLSNLLSGQYADCFSFSDFARIFADIPCRKLVILDTCHAGAVLPLDQRELKAALRVLQDDLMFTLTATEGGQEAVEDREKRLGRFTFHLIEGLRGTADQVTGNGDQEVSLRELVNYVKLSVSSESSADRSGPRQYPTAGPAELLEHADVPLSRKDE